MPTGGGQGGRKYVMYTQKNYFERNVIHEFRRFLEYLFVRFKRLDEEDVFYVI